MARRKRELICGYCRETFIRDRDREYCSPKCAGYAGARNKERILESAEVKTVWSYGGGVESVAMACLIYIGVLPKPDYAIMTLCGYDYKHTIDYLNQTTIPKLSEVGVNIETIKVADNNLFAPNGMIRLPAFTHKHGKPTKFRTLCNGSWKVEPALRWMRNKGIKRAINWIGINADEYPRRKRKSNAKWITYQYPLAESINDKPNLNMTRQDCIELIGKTWRKIPHKSACIICPNKTLKDWYELKHNHTEDWNRAVKIEKEMHKTNPNIFLHRTRVPLEQAPI